MATLPFQRASYSWKKFNPLVACLSILVGLVETSGCTAARSSPVGGPIASSQNGIGFPVESELGAGGVGLFGPDRRSVSLQDRITLYRQFAIRWGRFNSSVPISASHGMTDPEETAAFRRSGIKIFMSAVSTPNIIQSGSDLSAYKAGVSGLVYRYKPDIVAAENEVDNQNYDGSVNIYLGKVRILCATAHNVGSKCTDSGLTIKMIIALYLDQLIQVGDSGHISSVKALLNEWYGVRRGPGSTMSDWEDFKTREHVANADAMLRGLGSAGADFVDLHWYGKTDGGVSEDLQYKYLIPAVVNMLRNKTGLPVVGGEIGFEGPAGSDSQLSSVSVANELGSLKCSGVNLVILWNPGIGNYSGNSRALSLFDANGRPFNSASALAGAASRWNSLHCP